MTNFAILAAPCQEIAASGGLPYAPNGEVLLLAALLPDKDGALLDAGGVASFASPPRTLSWQVPATTGYWRSPALPPQAARAPWPTEILDLGSPATVNPAPALAPYPFADLAQPWQPGALPPGGDPLPPPPGVFGVLPLEQQVGNCVVFGEVASGLEPVAKAFVDVIGTGRVAETDAQGRFRIEGLPAGDFAVEASALNYNAEVRGVSTNPAAPVELRFNLTVKPAEGGSEEYTLEEESIVGEYQESGGGDLFIDVQAGPGISAVLSKEEFSKTGVSDAGDAVSKIAGANIVGGKYAVVRGLGDRYSNTLVNGALISSADPSKKAVQLDLFPSDLLQSVAIKKTFTPDLPAEFAGGTVLIETLRFPKERIVEAEIGTSWNSELDGTKMRTIQGREIDFWGETGDGLPPEAGQIGSFPIGHNGRRRPATPAQLEAAANAVVAWEAMHTSAPMKSGSRSVRAGENFAFTVGDTFNPIGDLQIGALVAFTHDESDDIQNDVNIGRDLQPGSDFLPGTEDDTLGRSQVEDRYTSAVEWGALASLGVKLGEKHQFGVTWFRNRSAEDQVSIGDNQRRTNGDFRTYLPSTDSNNPYGAGAFTSFGFENLVPVQRELDVFQLNGSHQIGETHRGPRIDWLLSRNEALEDRPHSSTLYFTQLDFTDPRIASEEGDVFNPELGEVETLADVYATGTPTLLSYRESLSTEEESNNARIDLTLPAYWRDDDHFLEFKVGANRFERDRKTRGRLFIYSLSQGLNANLLGDGGQYGEDYLDSFDSTTEPDGSDKFDGWSGSQAASLGDKLFLAEATTGGRTVRNVDTASELVSTYVMGTCNHGPWTLVGGARLERDSRSYQVLPGLNNPAFVNPAPVTQDNDSILPGITLTRDFGRENQFTTVLAWSRTIARPTFYEYAPVQTEDQATGDVIEGNPDLIDTFISNYDLRVEWNPGSDTSVALGLFHKSMTNPIAQAYNLTSKTWVNGETGTLQGIELEARQRFLEHWTATSNFTLIDSLLTYQQQVGTSGLQTIESSFEGQPDHIFNFILGYDHQPSGWSANVVYNFTGSYLTGVPLTDDSPSVRRDSFNSVDLIFAKRFDLWESVGTVKLKFGNVLDGTDTELFEGTDLIYRSYKPGRTASLSLEVEF